MMSQKAEALAKYVTAKEQGRLYQDLSTLGTDDIKWNLQWGDILDEGIKGFFAASPQTIDIPRNEFDARLLIGHLVKISYKTMIVDSMKLLSLLPFLKIHKQK